MTHINAINILSKYTAYLILLVLGAPFAHGLSLSAEVDRQTVALNETLRLIVTADTSTQQTIDFNQLDHQFDILNTQRSNQTQFINGKRSSTTSWILILAPKETGQLVIPSFELNGIYSQAITITVTDSATAITAIKEDAEVFLTVEVDKQSVYVQQQILLTFQLYYRIGLSGYDTESLTLPNTTIEAVDESNFQTQWNGQRYQVLKKVYALHPQSSGQLEIPAQSWRLEKSLRSFFGRGGNPYLYVKSDSIPITVKPMPATSTASHWLPSTNISLETSVSADTLQAKLGEPFNYPVTLSANGLTAAQLPDITLPTIDGFTLYADQAKTENVKSSTG